METTRRQLSNDLEILADLPTQQVNRLYWFPLLLFGILSLIAAVVMNAWDPETTNSWLVWAIGGPVGGIATSIFFARNSEDLGVQPKNPWVYPAIGVSIFIGCAVVGSMGSGAWIYGAILMVVGLGNIAFGLVDRYAQIAIAGAGLVAVGATAVLGSVESASVALISGLFLIAAGVFQRYLP